MRSAMRRTIALVVAAASLAGCVHKLIQQEPDPIVIFRNDSPDQADVYAVGSGGDPIRIGTVFAGRSEVFRVPGTIIGGSSRVNIIARMFPGGRVIRTGEFSLPPGESMTVRLTTDEKILSVLPSSER